MVVSQGRGFGSGGTPAPPGPVLGPKPSACVILDAALPIGQNECRPR